MVVNRHDVQKITNFSEESGVRERERQTDRQADRQRERETERQRDRDRQRRFPGVSSHKRQLRNYPKNQYFFLFSGISHYLLTQFLDEYRNIFWIFLSCRSYVFNSYSDFLKLFQS
jgi:hypothetical protein